MIVKEKTKNSFVNDWSVKKLVYSTIHTTLQKILRILIQFHKH